MSHLADPSLQRPVDAICDKWSTYSRSLRSSDKVYEALLARCFHKVSSERFFEIIHIAELSGAPLLMFHASDGWSTDMQQTLSAGVPGCRVHRVGTYKAEFLLEVVLLKTFDLSGDIVQALRFYPPRLMRSKTGWAVFASSLDCPRLASQSFDNICIDVFVQDCI